MHDCAIESPAGAEGVRISKTTAEFAWHSRADENELFLVPRGVEHV